MGYNGRPERYYKIFKVISCTGSTSLSEKAARDQCAHVQKEGSYVASAHAITTVGES
jgi:hypothetical protein